MNMTNYNEKLMFRDGGRIPKGVECPEGMKPRMEYGGYEKGLTVKEYFADYRQFGVPQEAEELLRIKDMIPKRMFEGEGKGSRVWDKSVVFQFENGQWASVPTTHNAYGVSFQQEMVSHVLEGRHDKFVQLLKETDRALDEGRTVADVIKYATPHAVPATRAGNLVLNKRVNGFAVYQRPDGNEVLSVLFGKGHRETMIPLAKTDLSPDARRATIDEKAKTPALSRALKK